MNQNQIIQECVILYSNYSQIKQKSNVFNFEKLSREKKELVRLLSSMEKGVDNLCAYFPAYCGMNLKKSTGNTSLNYDGYNLGELFSIASNRIKLIVSNIIAAKEVKDSLLFLMDCNYKIVTFLKSIGYDTNDSYPNLA